MRDTVEKHRPRLPLRELTSIFLTLPPVRAQIEACPASWINYVEWGGKHERQMRKEILSMARTTSVTRNANTYRAQETHWFEQDRLFKGQRKESISTVTTEKGDFYRGKQANKRGKYMT